VEYSKLWQCKEIEGIELLTASFQSFEFCKHWHDELAIGIIEQGAEGLNYRGSSLIIPQNNIVTINPAEVHTGFAGCDLGWSYRMFYFDPALIADHFSDAKNKVLPFIENPNIADPQLFKLLYNLHLSFEQPSFDLSKQSLLTLVFETLFNRYGNYKNIESNVYKTHKSNIHIRDHLLDNWQENITLVELEALSGRSKYQVIRGFDQQFGVTPHQFSLLVKINKAKDLLLLGNSCADTALLCGFFDQSHFNRNFKRAFGVSPKRYVAI
jgi:AraC-like DNA-binding protein